MGVSPFVYQGAVKPFNFPVGLGTIKVSCVYGPPCVGLGAVRRTLGGPVTGNRYRSIQLAFTTMPGGQRKNALALNQNPAAVPFRSSGNCSEYTSRLQSSTA